ncbi:MAG: alpha-galactosidase [Candidatus Omnitrophota bacterium]|jgi:hypothetical protein|nr:MAG: alpha-galactosidase [Candidatus Omnitrophota bacterium]
MIKKRKIISFFPLVFCLPISVFADDSTSLYQPHPSDWLISPIEVEAEVFIDGSNEQTLSFENGSHTVVLDNGLIARIFHVTPGTFATIDLVNRMTGDGVLRGVKPEAVIVIDGKPFEIGGLKGQPDYAYLNPEWLKDMHGGADAFSFSHLEKSEPLARYPWQPKRHAINAPWPPLGVSLSAHFKPPINALEKYDGLDVAIHYELYDGIPALAKWITVTNHTAHAVTIDSASTEILAVNEEQKHLFHAESNYAFADMDTNHWGPDWEYTSQVDYLYQSPVLFTSRYPLGPGMKLAPGETFESFITFEMLFDSDDRERQGLFRRRMLRTLTPQVTENPIFMHVRNSDSKTVRQAVDQCAEVGFEMVILTFWSGFDIESEDPDYIANFKADVEYAHGKGIEIGGYTLMCASRDVGDKNNCIDPITGKPGSKFGQSACLAGEWSDGYFRRVLNFIDAVGLDVIETDGPYHGDVCASTQHKHHSGLADSQFRQWQRCVDFYAECLKRGMYINTPDSYYYNGSQKLPMGYRETNWSLPRWRQILIARQNIFDGTYLKPPSMGWMFVPLVEYHGGGPAATLEPLSEHLTEYEWHLALNFGSGVIACYRGPRLYDTEETKTVVKKWVDFYKTYRKILSSDIIHVRRPDHKSIDCILHVNPNLRQRGLAMVYNPLDTPVNTQLKLPLYYTGLTTTAQIREQEGQAGTYHLDRAYTITLPVAMPAQSITWFVIE